MPRRFLECAFVYIFVDKVLIFKNNRFCFNKWWQMLIFPWMCFLTEKAETWPSPADFQNPFWLSRAVILCWLFQHTIFQKAVAHFFPVVTHPIKSSDSQQRVVLPPRVFSVVSGDVFWLSQLGCCLLLKSSEQRHRAALPNKNSAAWNVNHDRGKNPPVKARYLWQSVSAIFIC